MKEQTRTMEKTFTACEALTITRVFAALERQLEIASREGRYNDQMSMANLIGRLSYDVFGASRYDTRSPLCPESWTVTA